MIKLLKSKIDNKVDNNTSNNIDESKKKEHKLIKPTKAPKKVKPASFKTLSDNTESLANHLLVVESISKVFKEKRGIQEVSFSVMPGEFVFIIGPTGHGKTTLLRMLSGRLTPDSGNISLGGVDINNLDRTAFRKKIGYVSQNLDAVPRMTVEENIAYPLQTLRMDPAYIKERVNTLLKVFGLEHARTRLCNDQELSGGERQRMTIARSIVHDPDLLICDEPTGNLDKQTTYGILRTLNRVSMIGTTIICVTHDLDIVNLMQKRVITIQNGYIIDDSIGGKRNV